MRTSSTKLPPRPKVLQLRRRRADHDELITPAARVALDALERALMSGA